MNRIIPIEKESIAEIDFCEDEVLETTNRRSERLKNLKKATTLGNGYRRKVKLLFKKADGMVNEVETTVWAVGNTFVTLKAGITIPIHSIKKVDF